MPKRSETEGSTPAPHTVAHRPTAPEPHQLLQRRRPAPFRAKLRERRPQLPEPLGLAQLEGRDE